MCGIYGYIGQRNPAEVCIGGLERLEYRGYDSAGIAGISMGRMLSRKQIGKIQALKKLIDDEPLPLDLAIAHTRWATHGKPSAENAHPHFDEAETIAVVHNGIVENHAALRSRLREKGVTFRSDTDSEVIAQLISSLYKGDILKAVQDATAELQGFWAIAVIHKDHPEQIIAAARENPIAIAINRETREAFVSSDANAFQEKGLDVLFLHNNEVAVITRERIDVFDQNALLVVKKTERIEGDYSPVSKNGFEHFMLKEIFEQPKTVQQAFHGRILPETGTAHFEDLPFSNEELRSVERILILACGTSWHAGYIGASLLEDLARIPTQAEIASEFRYKNPIISKNTLVIAISQSGETLDTIAAVREVKSKGAKVIGICNVANSTLTREADAILFLKAGAEISVCSTKAFTSQLTVISLFTLLMARLRQMTQQEGQAFLAELQRLPEVIEYVLHQKDKIALLAKKYATFQNFFFLGRHYMYPASLEGALKLKEISYLNAVGYPAGEMKHGPIALIDSSLGVIGMCGNQKTYDKMLSNLMEVKARGGILLALVPEGCTEVENIADDLLFLPKICDPLAPIPYSVATQLLAYSIATEKERNIDQPRNLAKSVTVE